MQRQCCAGVTDFVFVVASHFHLVSAFRVPSGLCVPPNANTTLIGFIISHNPSSPPSKKALDLLRAANSTPYPASRTPPAPPLNYDLEVVESVPTTDQLRTILEYLPSKATSPSMAFLSAHPSSGGESSGERPGTIEGIVKLAEKNKNALRWPIVVDWEDGQVAVGDLEGVKKILEKIRKKRDGEEAEPEDWKQWTS